MKKTILSLLITLSFYSLSAQVRTKAPLPAETKTEIGERSISVFPNPSNGVITISMEGFEGKKTELRIMNVIGNVVYREVLQDASQRYAKTIDLNKLAKGLYYVKLETATFSDVRKIILR